jgi:hypothetical protein
MIDRSFHSPSGRDRSERLKATRRHRMRRELQVEPMEARQLLAGTITGQVFQDFNANGAFDGTSTVPNAGGSGSVGLAIDRGVGGVTVTAFDAGGQARGTATTAADGTYTLGAGGVGPYRVEFTGLPPGFLPGPAGPDSGTTVQFTPDGNSANVGLGLVIPADYTQDNPDLATSLYYFGDLVNGASAQLPAIVSFPYNAGSNSPNDFNSYFNPAAHTLTVPANQVGAVWGLAYNRTSQLLYASAFMKKHVSYGPSPDPTGNIYQVSPNGAVTTFANLNAIFGANTAGPNAHNTADYITDNFNTGWDAVGKTALGGADLSEDGSTLYVMNLFDRSLYALPTSGPLTPATVRRVSIPFNVPGATGANGADLRPFAVQVYRGTIYVGIVNTAQSTQNRADLHGYVYAVDPATLAFGAAPVFQFDLNYPRGQASTNSSALWNPWTVGFAELTPPAGALIYPQPWLTGLAFDPSGNIVLGIRDRAGDQGAIGAIEDPARPFSPFTQTISPGDTLRAFGSPATGWVLENNARGPQGQGAGPQNNGQGPGGVGTPAQANGPVPGSGEFYHNDDVQLPPGSGPVGTPDNNIHDEVSTGAVLQVPGTPDVVASSWDPLFTPANPGLAFFTGGFRWYNNNTGGYTKAYALYNSQTNGITFGKANGLGDVVALADPAPIEIGNRVFRDTNANGIQDPNELGIAGVTIQLFRGGTLVGTTITAADGSYLFNATDVPGGVLPNTAYEIRIATAQAAVSGLALSPANRGSDDAIDSDATAVGGNAVIPLTTGGPGASNHTFDVGFQGLSLGNLVFNDLNNNGTRDAGEPGLPGLTVQLFNGTGTSLLATTTTDGAGNYLFSDLVGGDYIVRVTPPAGFLSSSGTNGGATGPFEPAPDPDNNVDNDDNGTATGVLIGSAAVTLTPNGEPITDGDADPNSNLTVDFGLFRPLSLGDLVFNDVNNNGTRDAGEPGLDGVAVRLFDNAGTPVATTATTGGGLYRFGNLIPGNYTVEITPPAGFASSSGTNGGAVGPFEPAPDPDNDLNDDDNGTTIGAVIRSLAVTLTQGGEPADDGDVDPDTNLTVDFGLYRPLALGDLVFDDRNNNGVVDPGEPGLGGVPVSLFVDANGDGFADGPAIAATTTDAGGLYRFNSLTPNTYIVEASIPAGLASSSGSNGSVTGPFEPAPDPDNDGNNDDNGTSIGAVARSAPVTLTVGGEPTSDGDADPDTNLSVDFGFYRPLSLGDLVFNDLNNNGVVDAGEAGIPNVPVQLLTAGGTPIATTTTDDTGRYLFGNLAPGDYVVAITPPGGFLSSSGTNGGATGPFEPAPDPDANVNGDDNGTAVGTLIVSAPVTLTLGGEPTGDGDADPDTNLSVDFGLYRPASVGDRVFIDTNGDGRQDPGEPGRPGVTVRLIGPGGAVVGTTTTDAAGTYRFPNLVPGTYSVAFDPTTLPVGSVFSPQGQVGPKDPLDSDPDPATGRTESFLLAPGEDDTTWDAGILAQSSISGIVYVDPNNNGVVDPGETRIPGVTVRLTGTDDLGNPVDRTTTTGPDGQYRFTGLRPGRYGVVETQPAGFLDGRDTPGTGGGTSSPAADTIQPIVLGAGVEAAGNNFGELPPAQLTGFVFVDANGNGVREAGEAPVGGVILRLVGTDDLGNTVDRLTATATADGSYAFGNLRPGTYSVITVSTPPGLVDGLETREGIVLPGTAGSPIIPDIVLSPGESVSPNNNFGLFPVPRVASVQRFGIHAQPTRLVLTFTAPLDPARAQDVRNYRLIGPGNRSIPIVSAVYNPSDLTVTLRPAVRLNAHQVFQLIVSCGLPSGVAGAGGVLLDGNCDGLPGGDFVTRVDRSILVGFTDRFRTIVTIGPGQSARGARRAARLQGSTVSGGTASHLPGPRASSRPGRSSPQGPSHS